MKIVGLAAIAVAIASIWAAGPAEAQIVSFEHADANRDGKVTREEYQETQFIPAPRRFKYADVNADGILTRKEFPRTRPRNRERFPRSQR